MTNRLNIILLFVCLILTGLILQRQGLGFGKLEKLADSVFDSCKGAQFTPNCYDREIPRLMKAPFNLTMEDAFALTRLILKKDPKYAHCHVLGHKLSYIETDKDFTKWKDVVARCPTTICNNGCQHGALLRRFNSETLTDEQIKEIIPDISDVCEPRGKWNPVEVERSMCYHGIGHLMMFATGANINKVDSLCKQIGNKVDGRNYYQTCIEGAFMTVYQPLEAEDKALVKDIAPTIVEMPQFCNKFTGETFHACHREAWPLFREEVYTPNGLIKFCSYTTDVEAQKKCYATALNIITVILVLDDEGKLEKIADFCMRLPGKTRDLCYASASRRLVQVDPSLVNQALGVCKLAEAEGLSAACYNELVRFSSITYHRESKQRISYCNKFPGLWRNRCIKEEINWETQ